MSEPCLFGGALSFVSVYLPTKTMTSLYPCDMWRFWVMMGVRRSERKRLLLVFALPLVVYFGFYQLSPILSRDSRWDYYRNDLEARIAESERRKDSMTESWLQSGPYPIQQLTQAEWERSGLSRHASIRLTRYLTAGGRVASTKDFERLDLGDSLWRSRMASALQFPDESISSYDFSPKRRTEQWRFSLMSSPLDPNVVNHQELVEAGVPSRIADRWLSYLEAGGKFRSADEVLLLYGMDSLWFQSNKDNIQLNREEVRSVSILELNQIDTVAWREERVPNWMVDRVQEYGDRLGGYVDKTQLWELGLDTPRTEGLLKLASVNGLVRQFSLNEASFDQLSAHPYIGYSRARSLDYFRTRVRPVQRLEDLVQLEGWEDTASYRFLKYYCKGLLWE